jgi:putative tryptophan/tyrosine transport system substrate-binding protein
VKRRDFVTLLGGAAATWPLAARAQQPAMPVIGFLHPGSAADWTDLADAFREGLKEEGFVEGHSITIEYRWANDDYGQLPALSADLVGRGVAVIDASGGIASALAAKAATTTIPIVFEAGGDPIKTGLVSTLNRPDGNVTGISLMSIDLVAKRLELLHELSAAAINIGFLANTSGSNAGPELSELQNAAHTLSLQIHVLTAEKESDFEAVFALLATQKVDALIVGADPFFTSQRGKIVTLIAQHAIPAIYPFREYARAGGLMSFGASIGYANYLAGLYVGRILKGAKPADLPVQLPDKFEFVLNLKTAKTLGLTVPLLLLGRADEVIE